MLDALQKVETESNTLKDEITQLNNQNTILNENLQQLSSSFDEAKKMINQVEQQKQDLDYIR
jgi:uncharacterized coiled-coil DUF342 family protein